MHYLLHKPVAGKAGDLPVMNLFSKKKGAHGAF
jgi:hypothetical protein